MAKTNALYTGWGNKPHLITMPAATLTLAERIRRVPDMCSSIEDPANITMADGRSEQAGRTLEASIVQVCPGHIMSADHISEESSRIHRRSATVAHLIELAAFHREVLRGYSYVYAFGGTALKDGFPMIPYLILMADADGESFAIAQRRIRGGDRIFRGTRREAFVLIDDLGPCGNLACKGCTGT